MREKMLLAKERDQRYPNVDALRNALDTAPHPSPPPSAKLEGGRRRTDESERRSASLALRREDLDAYEAALRHRRWLGVIVRYRRRNCFRCQEPT